MAKSSVPDYSKLKSDRLKIQKDFRKGWDKWAENLPKAGKHAKKLKEKVSAQDKLAQDCTAEMEKHFKNCEAQMIAMQLAIDKAAKALMSGEGIKGTVAPAKVIKSAKSVIDGQVEAINAIMAKINGELKKDRATINHIKDLQE